MTNLKERFDAKWLVDANGCHIWNACKSNGEYGSIKYNGRMVLATHLVWYLNTGDWPANLGLMACHNCDVRPCVNFNHLFLGTNADNMADMVSKNRSNKVKGSAHGNAKLVEADIIQIKLLIEDGIDNSEIGRRYRVDHSTVSKIRRGLSWTHVP